ncbi:MAG TPA: NTP transferase domain-containing protein [Terriglobia bacterium]|nr:NTP transferase domain-containing protein [Terriglobia bacterium]
MMRATIVPIILAADAPAPGGFLRPFALFGNRTALQIAIDNCRTLAAPIVVLGRRADARSDRSVADALNDCEILIHRSNGSGQLSSLLAALRRLPPDAAFMLYPVDYPLLFPAVVRRLAEGFESRLPRHTIVAPRFRGRSGHPVIFAPEMRGELARAQTAREVVYHHPRRVKFVGVWTPAIWQDFDTEASYQRRLVEYIGKHRTHTTLAPFGGEGVRACRDGCGGRSNPKSKI